jgi:cell division protein ZapE
VSQFPAVVAIRPEDVLRGFVPTRRFERVSFDSYVPDPRFPSQSAALHRMRSFVSSVAPRKRAWQPFARPKHGRRAIYLDGGYGVGKTHLLAATYHALPNHTRFYLTFADLAYTSTRLGMQPTLLAFSTADLVCIDEFELDDVAQTRMASMFLRQLLGHQQVHVVTTSNTLPFELGQGRFAADAFQREIGDIAAAFDVISIDGEDYRHRHWGDLVHPRLLTRADLRARFHVHRPVAVLLTWPELANELERVHPVHYGQIAAQLDALYIDGLSTIDVQAVALRLVHFVDKLYEEEVRLSLSAAVPLPDIFDPSYRHGGYEKKYRRCLSRIHELVAETEATLPAGERIASQVQLG